MISWREQILGRTGPRRVKNRSFWMKEGFGEVLCSLAPEEATLAFGKQMNPSTPAVGPKRPFKARQN